CLILLLLTLGTVIEGAPVVLIMTPLLMPISTYIGFDPVYFGVLITLTISITSNTPPIAISLLTAYKILNVAILKNFHHLFIFIGLMFVSLLIVAVVPELALFIPKVNG